MVRSVLDSSEFGARFSFHLLVTLLIVLWFAGGSSRADVFGQPVSRLVAWGLLVAFVLVSPVFYWQRVKPLVVFLGGLILLVLLQLIPLPPSIWTGLPGRGLLTQAAEVSGQVQPWRPISLSPSGTVNALGSLVVPTCVLALAANLNRDYHWRIGGLLLALVFAGCLAAILQFAGARYGNPLINYQTGSISGNFANRNHFALFVAFGCLIAPVWGFQAGRYRHRKAIVGISLLPFFLLVIIATGSRTGLAIGILAILAGLVIVRRNIAQALQSRSRGQVYGAAAAFLAMLVLPVVVSFYLDRAVALERTLDLQVADDQRSLALPFVIDAILRYFPVGAGFGTFDPVYRIGEPHALLQPAYFNHAHNDWFEIILEGGILSAIAVFAALICGVFAAQRIIRKGRDGMALANVGMVALLLIMFASIFDYPARTPMWMAIIVIAAVWVHAGFRSSSPTPSLAQP